MLTMRSPRFSAAILTLSPVLLYYTAFYGRSRPQKSDCLLLGPAEEEEVLFLPPPSPPPPPATIKIPCAMTTEVTYRMGNKILNYWLLISLAKINNCSAFLTPKMAEELLPLFNLSRPVLSQEEYFSTSWTFVDIEEAGTKSRAEFAGKNIFLVSQAMYYLPPTSFLPELRRELALKPDVVAGAGRKLREIGRRTGSAETFVSVHVRRSDYIFISWVSRLIPADARFYASAMDHFRSKYRKVAFVVVSDDMEWCERNIDNKKGDVFYEGGGSAIDDFALLANCNHSVIGYSSFAYFAAILSGGDVVYYANYSYPENAFFQRLNFGDMALEHWTPIAADLSQLYRFSPSVEKMYDLLHHYYHQWLNFFFPLYSVMVVAFSPLFYLPDYFALY